jgi:hypothetical protein
MGKRHGFENHTVNLRKCELHTLPGGLLPMRRLIESPRVAISPVSLFLLQPAKNYYSFTTVESFHRRPGVPFGGMDHLDHGKHMRNLGAGRGSRTPKTRRSADFESAASASSAIPACIYKPRKTGDLTGFRTLTPRFVIAPVAVLVALAFRPLTRDRWE